jgi:diaminopimelate decarboxylase
MNKMNTLSLSLFVFLIKSKFGIPIGDMDKLVALTTQHNVKVVGLHAHTGSGILKETENWVEVARLLYSLLLKVQNNSNRIESNRT